jgi:hypothetical protein
MNDRETQPIVTVPTNPGMTKLPDNYPVSLSEPQIFYDQSGQSVSIRPGRNSLGQVIVRYIDGPTLSQTFRVEGCIIDSQRILQESSSRFPNSLHDRWTLLSRRVLRKFGILPPTKWNFKTPSSH